MWNYDKASKNGDYGEFVCDAGERPRFAVVHDRTERGTTSAERTAIVRHALHDEPIHFNDLGCYYWMYDFKQAGNWVEMWHGDDDESIFDVMHLIVTSDPFESLPVTA